VRLTPAGEVLHRDVDAALTLLTRGVERTEARGGITAPPGGGVVQPEYRPPPHPGRAPGAALVEEAAGFTRHHRVRQPS
jgi:hypothetical protein